MKRKVYIFLVGTMGYGYWSIGGAEMYIAGKANYLKEKGWKVFVCTPCPRKDGCIIPSLNEYLEVGAGWTFLATPPYKFKRYEQEQALHFMISRLSLHDYENCEILIETTWDFLGYWGELLASKIKAKHFNFLLNENYDESYYKDNLDFFYFKWKRNELIPSVNSFMENMFNGYKNITKPLIKMPETVREQDAVQDIEVANINDIPRLDWNICCMGRQVKYYVHHMIVAVGELAQKYPNKQIHFFIVGNADCRLDLLKQTFGNLSNVKLTLFRDLVPIPRILFTKFDVVMAGSGTAIFAANENVLTITANAKDFDKTPGVLGYDTKDAMYGKDAKNISYLEALENVFVKQLYKNKKSSLPKLLPAKHYYENFWKIVKKSAPQKEYYVERLMQERMRDWIAIFPFGIIPKDMRIVIYGANDMSRDYIKQVEGQNYCQIVCTVDENAEEYDRTVEPLNRLQKIDYDAIVIATAPQEAQAAYEKILSIVPQMQGRIIYNFSIIRV